MRHNRQKKRQAVSIVKSEYTPFLPSLTRSSVWTSFPCVCEAREETLLLLLFLHVKNLPLLCSNLLASSLSNLAPDAKGCGEEKRGTRMHAHPIVLFARKKEAPDENEEPFSGAFFQASFLSTSFPQVDTCLPHSVSILLLLPQVDWGRRCFKKHCSRSCLEP